MKQTMVLEPVGHMEALTLSLLKNKAKEIFIYLKDLETGIEMEFTNFLNKFQINEATYILVLLSQLKRPQFFLTRIVNNIRANAFNKDIANLWYANTDIQFILDPYATATYCTSYMPKVDKSITTELKSILQKCIAEKTDANLRNLKVRQCFFKCPTNVNSIGNLSHLVYSIVSFFAFICIYKYFTITRTSFCIKTSITAFKVEQRIYRCHVQIYSR
jgi:hypothetical protein